MLNRQVHNALFIGDEEKAPLYTYSPPNAPTTFTYQVFNQKKRPQQDRMMVYVCDNYASLPSSAKTRIETAIPRYLQMFHDQDKTTCGTTMLSVCISRKDRNSVNIATSSVGKNQVGYNYFNSDSPP